MSILVGIICPSAIILASDSQWSDSLSGTTAYAEKISVVHFSADEVLIAYAGLRPIAHRIIELATEAAMGTVIQNASTVLQIVEGAIRTLKSQLDQDQWESGARSGCTLMLAYYANKKPCLYTIDVYGYGVASVPFNHYATAGCVALADYLLQEFAEPGTEGNVAITTAIYVIKKLKDHQKMYCGGDTTVKIIQQLFQSNWAPNYYVGKSSGMFQSVINQTEQRLVEMEVQTKVERNEKAVSILKQIAADAWQKHLEKVKAEAIEDAKRRSRASDK